MDLNKATSKKAMIALIATLAWPTILEQFLQTIVVYADTAMVGQLGKEASAAVGLITPVTWLTNAPAFSLGIGVMAFIARKNGASDFKDVKTAAMQGIYLALMVGAVISAFMMIASPFLPYWMGGEGVVAKGASVYLLITGAGFIFRSLDMVIGCMIRGTGDTRTPMIVNLLMNIVNIVGNFIFIYPTRVMTLFGISFKVFGYGYGVAGAAIGTSLSALFGGVVMMIVLWKNEVLSPHKESKRINGNVMYQCVRVGLPLALQRIVVFTGYVVFTSEVAALGTVLLAAHSIAITAEEMVYIPGFGMQEAGSALIGNAMGFGDERKMDKLARMLIIITVLIMTVTGSLLFAFPGRLMSLFTNDAEVIANGIIVLRMVAVSEPIYGALIMMEGIFNGVGNTKTTFLVGVCTMWIVRVLMAYICIHVWHLGLVAVWSCMIAENVTKALILGVLYIRGVWKKGAVKYS
ncbi:MAG: MATE family efflux transporter [Lachnospiraceae bacterium]|nr:MATE family efflux transporter [Lachnospiraceae bacterium]